QQIHKNLLSNAFKFTSHGQVAMNVRTATEGWTPDHPVLSHAQGVFATSIADTGIGIPPEKQRIIFEAFQQADAGTSRKYGGTGLGLAISRELASLLGGEIQLRSTPGVGSTFTLYLPTTYTGPSVTIASPGGPESENRHAFGQPMVRAVERPMEQLPDDREEIVAGDAVMLIVEDDPAYARLLLDEAHEQGFKVL